MKIQKIILRAEEGDTLRDLEAVGKKVRAFANELRSEGNVEVEFVDGRFHYHNNVLYRLTMGGAGNFHYIGGEDRGGRKSGS